MPHTNQPFGLWVVEWLKQYAFDHAEDDGVGADAYSKGSQQLATGTVIVDAPAATVAGGVALYARVSGADPKADLYRQLSRLTEYAVAKKMLSPMR